MQKQIHINAYTKQDGTQVREHFRNIETNDYRTPPIVPENPGGPVIDEQNHNIFEKLFPNIFNSTMNMNSAPVLQGGVSVDVGFPTGGIGDVLGSIGGALGAIIGVGIELAPIAIQIYQAMNSGNGQAVEYLKPQFDTKIKQLDTKVAHMKTNIDNNVAKLVNAKNQAEYSKIYEPLQKDWQEYQQVKNIVNRIKVHANNGDFQSVANELGNFVSESPAGKAIMTNPLMQNVITNLQKNFYNPDGMTLEEQVVNKFTKVGSKMMPVAGANLQNAMQNFKYANNNPHAHILNSREEITNQSLKKLMDNVRIPKDSRGVIYDNNSKQSKLLWRSPEIQNFVRNNFVNLLIDKTPKAYDIEFVVKQNFEGLDNFAGLQHCKLYNPQITPDGYFKGIIVDYYDFEYRDYTDDVKKNIFIYANNWGYKMQEKGLLENQFNIYIIFEKLW